MKRQLVVGAQVTADPNTMLFHSETKLTDWVCESGLQNGALDDWSPVMTGIVALEGVARVEVTPYTVAVVKGALHEWPKLAPKVLRVLLDWHNHVSLMNGVEEPQREILNQPELEAQREEILEAEPEQPPSQESPLPSRWTGEYWYGYF